MFLLVQLVGSALVLVAFIAGPGGPSRAPLARLPDAQPRWLDRARRERDRRSAVGLPRARGGVVGSLTDRSAPELRSALGARTGRRRRCGPGAGPRAPRMRLVVSKEEILKALEVVIDPELHRSIVELDMVRSIEPSANGVVDVTVSLTTAGLPDQGPLPDRRRGRRLEARGRDPRERLLRRAQRRAEGGAAAEARPRQRCPRARSRRWRT